MLTISPFLAQRPLSVITCVLALAAGSACNKKSDSPSSEKAAKSGAAANSADSKSSADSAALSENAPEQSAPALSESVVKDFVMQWVKAQNAGDFAGYAALYAERLIGIKRSGERTSSFDREGWLADRETMFSRPFTVKVDGIKITSVGTTSIVLFEQTWSNPRFKDVGPKQLLLTVEEGKPRIAREEMFASKVGGTEEMPAPLSTGQFLFTWTAGNEVRLILREEPKLNWMTGHPGRSPGGALVRPLAPEVIPKHLRELTAQSYEVFDATGRRCAAKAEKLEVLIDLIPYAGPVDLEEELPPGYSAQQRDMDLWGLSEMGGRFLTLKVVPEAGCNKPVWGRAATSARAQPWKMSEVTGSARAPWFAAARREKGFREAAALANSEDGPPDWKESSSGDSVRLFESPEGSRYALVVMTAPGWACNQLEEQRYWVILRVQGETKTPVGGQMEWSVPQHAVLLPGSDEPAFVNQNEVYQMVGGRYQLVLNQGPAMFSCGC